jgi:hypothetical protein
MSDEERRRFRQNIRLATLLLSRVAPWLAEMGYLIDQHRREEKLLERVWGGLWVVGGVIALLSWLQVVEESAVYYPGAFITAIFLRQWLRPKSRVELDIDALQRRAFPILLRLEELGLQDRTIFSWILTIVEDANEENLRACRNRYFGSNEHPLVENADYIDEDEQEIPLERPSDTFSFLEKTETWSRAQLEIARQICSEATHHNPAASA